MTGDETPHTNQGGRRVLIVCKGNICRSPTAEVVLRTLGGQAVEVRSAGTQNWHQGKPAHLDMIAAAAARGYDLAGHRAAQVTLDDILWADDVLAADDETSLVLAERFGSEYTRRAMLYLGDRDLEDPWNRSPDVFRRVLDDIESGARGYLALTQHDTSP